MTEEWIHEPRKKQKRKKRRHRHIEDWISENDIEWDSQTWPGFNPDPEA